MQQLDGSAPDGEDLAFARLFIAQIESRFTTASTVPEHRHQYLAHAWLSVEQQDEFDQLVALIQRDGYCSRFWRQTWMYIDLDGRAYWPSQSWYGVDTGKPNTMLNRRRLDDGQLRLELEG